MFLKNVSFHGILLDSLFTDGNEDWRTVRDLVSAGIKDGTVRPLSHSTFKRDQVEQAFRFMATGKHIGKVLIEVRGNYIRIKLYE